jgi:CRP/FNR family cyclic AMP-dependent transcriptional regulator
LSERLAVCEGRLSELIRKEVPARLAGPILRLSEHHGVVTDDGGRRIPTRYTHRQLASMIGSNREAEESGRGGEIRDRYIHVVDLETLERAAQ